MTDTLSRDSNISSSGSSDNLAWSFINFCYKTEEDYKQMLLDGKTKYSLLDTFNSIDDQLTGNKVCKTLSKLPNVDGLR